MKGERGLYSCLKTLRGYGTGETAEECESAAWRDLQKAFDQAYEGCTFRVESKRWKQTRISA